MSTVHVPEDLLVKLRAVEGDDGADLSELVTRALIRYLDRADPDALLARVREREAALARAGISEEDIERFFQQWRRGNGSSR